MEPVPSFSERRTSIKKGFPENVVILSIIFFVLIAAFFITWIKMNKPIVSEEKAKYIGNHSVLYIQLGCSHCKRQEEIFGSNVKYLTIIDCFKNTTICIESEITSVPTWIINGEKYEGVFNEKELLSYIE